MAEFLARPDAVALPSLGVCAVAACPRQVSTSREVYCDTHVMRLRRARRGHGVDDEASWRVTESPVTRAGHAVLIALPTLVVVQVLFGVAQRAGEGVKTRDPVLRWICDELRRQQVSTVADAVAPGDTERRGAINSLITARRGVLHPETEIPRSTPRSTARHRVPTDDEWTEFLGHFERRKVSTGTCGRAFGTPCIHEHACIRCSMLWPDPAQRERLVEIRDNLTARIAEAQHEGWLGDVEGLQVSLDGANHKLAQVERRQPRPAAVDVGIPALTPTP